MDHNKGLQNGGGSGIWLLPPHFVDIGYGSSVACTVAVYDLCTTYEWPMYDLYMFCIWPIMWPYIFIYMYRFLGLFIYGKVSCGGFEYAHILTMPSLVLLNFLWKTLLKSFLGLA